MNCWSCNEKLIWGGDHSGEDYDTEDYNIVTNLSCPECDAMVIVYHQPVEKEQTSICCGAALVENTDFCSQCKEHTGDNK